jgi:hypothetical protein
MDHHPIEEMGGRAGPQRPFRLRRERPRTNAEARLFQAVEAAFDIGHQDLCAATRGRCEIAFARQTGMYLARVTLGMTLSKAGNLFGRDRTTASHACRLVEDWRDDPDFDALLLAIESFVLQTDAHDGRTRR